MKQVFNLLTGKFDLVGSGGGSSSLETEQFTPTNGQTIFQLADIPIGKVIFTINGNQINSTAFSVASSIVTYNPTANEDYIIQAIDNIQFNYLK